MRQLTETNCEVRNIINLELPQWKSSDSQIQEDAGLLEYSKKSSKTFGGFLNNDCTYSWLSQGSHLIVLDVKAGKCITSWTFSDKITTVSPFPARKGCVPLLLVGLDNNAIKIKDSIGNLCIFDCFSSNILTTIQVPAGVEKACVIHGGAEWEEFNEKRPDTILAENSGLIFAALRNLQHIIIDVNRDFWSRSCYEGKTIIATLEFINVTPLSAMQNPKNNKIELTHLAYNLMDKEIEQYIGFDRQEFEATPLINENLCSVLLSSTKTGCLITGCLGRVIIWQNDGSIGWISPPFDENAYVTHVALLEPSDDPKPFYYLWVVCQSDAPDSAAVFRMYMLMFKSKHNDKSNDGSSLYFNLESEPTLKFELELEQGERVHSLLAIERENPRDASDTNTRRGEESLLLIRTEERVLLFDLNRWYKEQMPCTMARCRNPNSVMASYRTQQDDTLPKGIISCCYVYRSLREFPNKGPHSPEELFFPNSLNFEWVDLLEGSLVFWLTRGVQSELLRDITLTGPIVLVMPLETYRKCLNVGLVPFDSTPQDFSYEVEPTAACQMLLSLCLEQRWTNFLSRCAIEWSDGSATYLYSEFLRWSVQRASEIKLMTDRLCIPLFDLSGANIDESQVKTLRYCAQQLECLATVVSKLPNPETDLSKHKRALKRIATYLQVLLWFYDVGLLPESQEVDEDDDMSMLPSVKIPYPRNKLIESYKRKRRNDCNEENKEDNILFIDQLIIRDCLPLKAQWEKETDSDCPNQGGLYPPPSLQSLLRSFLTDCHREEQNEEEEENWELPETTSKHCIVIYLLMDLAMLLEGTNSAVDRLITYPAAFKMSPSIIKLTQAFWLLDHENYDGFFKIMTGQFVTNVDIKDWQHKLAINALLKNDQHKLALIYLRVIKPPLSSLDDQSTMIELAVEQGHVQTAFHARPPLHHGQLLTSFFHACKNNGKLKDILHLSLDPEEEEAFVKYLKDSGNEEIKLIYYLQRGRHTEVSDIFSINTNIHPRETEQTKFQPRTLHLLKAFNNTLPEITKLFASSLSKSIIPPANGRPFVPFSMMRNTNEPRGFHPKPMSQTRDKVNGICELAIQKTRETCLRPDRGSPGTSNYVPFLAAPYTTINFGPKFAGQTSEQSDANCVIYPERKVIVGKRTLDMVGNSEDYDDSGIEKKKRKLNESDQDVDSLASDSSPGKFRRLSMSQVCNTPLIKRKVANEPNGSVTETPHSILKIRQMLHNNSRSPSYNYAQGEVSDEEDVIKSSMSNELRPLRQIRFSVDRLSGYDDSGLSANETQNEVENSGISRINTEEGSCTEESYYSPNMTGKSLRDNTILSDTSITRTFRGPRPRPCLRRSSHNSRESSEEPSCLNNSSSSSTLNISEQDISTEFKNVPWSSLIARRLSALSSSIHCASILSNDTSFESSPLKKPLTICNNERDDSNEFEESDDSSEDNIQVILNLNKEKEERNQNDCAMKKDEEKKQNERSPSENVLDFNEKNTEHQQMQKLETETEDSEDDTNETFKSTSDSFDDNKVKIMTNITQFQDNISQLENLQSERYHVFAEHSLTENFLNVQREESRNYSLTKPIFINNTGIVGFKENEYNITDDESLDEGDINQPCKRLMPPSIEKEGNNEEDDFVLSFSNSDEEKKRENNEQQELKEKDFSLNSVAKINNLLSENVDNQKKLNTAVTNKVKQILVQVMKSPGVPDIDIEEIPSPSEEQDEPLQDPNKLTIPENPLLELAEDEGEEQPLEEKQTSKSHAKKSPRNLKKRKSSESSEANSEKSTNTRARRNRSTTKETSSKTKVEKPSRKTRATSTAKENIETNTTVEKIVEEQVERKSPTRSRSTRASPTAKDTSIVTGKKTVVTRRTRAGSVTIDEDLPSAHTRSRRAESIAKDEEQSMLTTKRTTRAGSVINNEPTNKENVKTRSESIAKEEEKPIPRKTRASSLAKEINKEEIKILTPERRSSRASSIAKDMVPEKQDEINKKPGRKCGSSVSKEVPSIIEPNRRGRRSTSLLKEIILEESVSLLESPASARRTRASRISEILPSSPAANTRSRRSSIQSIPDELEEILSVPSTSKSKSVLEKEKTTTRDRRATSVDSAIIIPAGKRVTRSVLAKASIIEEVIPEETTPVKTKKQPARKKRATSVNGVEVEKEKAKTLGKSKRSRKSSENKDYQFSYPEQAGDVPASSEGICKTPTFQFSEPTGLQKFITPICYDEEPSYETTNDLKQEDIDNEKQKLTKIRRQPRACFVMPKKIKDKTK